MSDGSLVLHLAAKGDGVTDDGRYASGAVPGDWVTADGALQRGPHYAEPPCRHFALRPAPGCGGCQLQHCDEQVLADFVTGRVLQAARGKHIEPEIVAPAHLSPPASRRRATLRAVNGGGRPLIGFREEGSHRLIDLKECPVLRPDLLAIVAPLRDLLAPRGGRYGVDVELTLTDQGVDCGLKGISVEGLAQTEAMLDFARANDLARLTLDQGHGRECLWEPEPVTVTLSGTAVPFPPGAFLQATADGEAALVDAAREWLGDCATVADLFSGLGTFAFALAGPAKVLAVEAARDAHLACQAAARASGRPVFAQHRDLFRNPLQSEELNRFAAVLLDPPRAGAREQVAQLAASGVPRVVYVSCNPSTWARDAEALVASGYRLREVRPVGQFRWSTHVELASLFTR